MEDKIIYMPCDTVEKFMRDAFVAAGVPAEDAALCANVLISADKRGIDSHGVGRLCSFYLDRIRDKVQQAVTNVEFVRKSGATAVVDGHAGMAMVVAKKSMEYAMECARKYGVGVVAVRNSSHFGRAGYYADLAAKEGMIGFCVTNARPARTNSAPTRWRSPCPRTRRSRSPSTARRASPSAARSNSTAASARMCLRGG